MGWNYRDGNAFYNIPNEDGKNFKKFIKGKTLSNAQVNSMVNSFASHLIIFDDPKDGGNVTIVNKLTKPQAEQLLGEPNLSSNWDAFISSRYEETQLTFLFGLKFNVDLMNDKTTTRATDFYTIGVYYFQDHLNDELTCVFSVSEQADMGSFDSAGQPIKYEKLIRNYIYEPQPQRYPIEVSKVVKNWLTKWVEGHASAYNLPSSRPFYFLNYNDGMLSFNGTKHGVGDNDFISLLGYPNSTTGFGGRPNNKTNPLRYL